jgi:hypothetical protein
VLDLAISSRAFSSGLDIKTPLGIFSAKKVPLSPTGEILILTSSAIPIARLERESFLSSVYNVIISGGGFYQFARDKSLSRTWTCNGEGKLFRVSEMSNRRFLFSERARDVAEFTKSSRFLNDYEIRVFNDEDLKR